MKFLKRFVLSYIKSNFSHEYVKERNEILKSLTEGMRETFTEDNIPTQYFSLVKWIIENDPETKRLLKDTPGFQSVLINAISESVKSARIK